MNIVDLTKYPFSLDRTLFRKEVVDIFLAEPPGTGTGILATKTRYIVNKLNNHDVFLSRPAQLNNGLDFTLNVSNIDFNHGLLNAEGKKKRKTTRPSHSHIIDDLKCKKNENPSLYKSFEAEIDLIYQVKKRSTNVFPFTKGHDSEVILECIKWLFLEQDITYWHNSGRAMFYKSIKYI